MARRAPDHCGATPEIANRDEDFELFVLEDIAARRRLQRRVG
jgi:hypothetical protein